MSPMLVFFPILSITLACSACVLRKGIKDSHSFPQDLAGSLVSFVFLSSFLLPFFLTPSPLLQLCQRNCFDLFLRGPGCHEFSLMMLSEALSGVWTIADLDQEPRTPQAVPTMATPRPGLARPAVARSQPDLHSHHPTTLHSLSY